MPDPRYTPTDVRLTEDETEAIVAGWTDDGTIVATLERIIAARVAAERERIAQAIEDNPGPDPSPASHAWWSGWIEGRDAAGRIVRGTDKTIAPLPYVHPLDPRFS